MWTCPSGYTKIIQSKKYVQPIIMQINPQINVFINKSIFKLLFISITCFFLEGI